MKGSVLLRVPPTKQSSGNPPNPTKCLFSATFDNCSWFPCANLHHTLQHVKAGLAERLSSVAPRETLLPGIVLGCDFGETWPWGLVGNGTGCLFGAEPPREVTASQTVLRARAGDCQPWGLLKEWLHHLVLPFLEMITCLRTIFNFSRDVETLFSCWM